MQAFALLQLKSWTISEAFGGDEKQNLLTVGISDCSARRRWLLVKRFRG